MSGSKTFKEFPAESRIGRDNQVFDENDIRQVSNPYQMSRDGLN